MEGQEEHTNGNSDDIETKFERAIHTIEWSHDSIPLSSFVDKHQLPQIIQVDDGYYGDDDDGSLSTGQILKIHCLKTTKKVIARDYAGNEIHIPLNTSNRVQLKPNNYQTVYKCVADLANAKPTPKYVEASQGYYNVASDSTTELSIEPGDRLEVIATETNGKLHSRKKSLSWVKFLNGSGIEIKLPFDCTAAFTPLVDLESYYLGQVISRSNFPIYVKFLNEARSYGEDITLEQQLASNQFAKLGVLKLECVYDEEMVIASCGENDVRVIFTLPKALQITLRTAMGCLKGDPAYVDLCRTYNDFTDLEKKAVNRHDSEVFMRGRSKVKGYRYVRSISSQKQVTHPERKSSLTQHDSDTPSANGRLDSREKIAAERKLSGQFGFVGVTSESPTGNHNEDSSGLVTLDENSENPVQTWYEETDNDMIYPNLFNREKRRSYTTNDLQTKRRSGSFTEGITNVAVKQRKDTSLENPEFKIPNDLSSLDIDGVCKCLRKLNMSHFEDDFRFNQVDGSLLTALDESSLDDLGVGKFHRKKLMNFIDGWRPENAKPPVTEV